MRTSIPNGALDETRNLTLTKIEEYDGDAAVLAVEFRGYSAVLIEPEALT